MGITSTVHYLGNLRTKSVHTRSGDEIISDAPLDNNGKGEAFSPTDMAATSLANCMLTIMGIKAQNMGVNLNDVTIDVEKIMAANPRRIAQINLDITIVGTFSSDVKRSLEIAGVNCPVAKSLHPDLIQSFNFVWKDKK